MEAPTTALSETSHENNVGQVADQALEAELARFEDEERARLGMKTKQEDKTVHWVDSLPSTFTASQRAHTTLLVSGLTVAHDLFVQAGLQGAGYQVRALEMPDNDSLRMGKEFGNRGQCNPTYFTVGNLIKHLTKLRDDDGLSTEEIIEKYIFLTAGACGPCRFGTYVTEYRKALRDSGFEGFRVLLFEQTGLKQATGEEAGLQINLAFTTGLLKAFLLGDTLNALRYRIRPYETESGATDKAFEACKKDVAQVLSRQGIGSWTGLVSLMIRCRRRMGSVVVDRTRTKPRVSIIGEFWAMTTEGDGNYRLQSFLESEGAEVDIQLITAWILYMVWQGRWDTNVRSSLRKADSGRRGLEGVDVAKRKVMLFAAEKLLRGCFQTVANTVGLHGYHLPDMDELAEVSHRFYDNRLRGGEGHMEVGKLIQNVLHNKVTMTLSVKPFGCMPSSSVSDGVQSLITEIHPSAIYLAIETTGDGAVNVYSRIQMQLFKAREAAKKEVCRALTDVGLDEESFKRILARRPRFSRALHRAPHRAGCTSADLAYQVGEAERPLVTRVAARLKGLSRDVAQKVRARGASFQASRSVRLQGADAAAEAQPPVATAA